MVSSTSRKVSHGMSLSEPTRRPPGNRRPMVEKVDTDSPPPPARPVRRAAQRSLKEHRTSALFEGGALDSQLSDSQYIRDLVQSADKKADKDATCLQDVQPEAAREPSFEMPESQTQVEDFDYTGSPLRDLSPEVPFFEAAALAKDEPGPRKTSQRLGAQSFLARLKPAEFVAMNSVAMVIEKYRRRLEETQQHLDELTHDHLDLMNNCRRLEDYNARLRGALDEHNVEIPDEEESQYM